MTAAITGPIAWRKSTAQSIDTKTGAACSISLSTGPLYFDQLAGTPQYLLRAQGDRRQVSRPADDAYPPLHAAQ
jgi:hypothetical protein